MNVRVSVTSQAHENKATQLDAAISHPDTDPFTGELYFTYTAQCVKE